MSRIGKKPIPIPTGVKIAVADGKVSVKGPKGELSRVLPELVSVKVEGAVAQVNRADDTQDARARHGLVRALLQNMVTGVTQGFERKLEINGVGYKAEVAGDKVTLSLGLSYPVNYDLPKGVAAKVDKNILVLTSIDRELVGRVAATIRSFRKPEPYQGKGVKYVEETIKRKVGKTGAA
jgi:large subunit ribosomal protein L6